jgi:hypothetical integral membrane protein (TIGR02206 family)
MGKLRTPAIIEAFSPFWWQTTLVVVSLIIIIVRLPISFKALKHRYYDFAIAGVFIVNTLLENIYNYQAGFWNLQQSLPIHLCSISNIMCIIVLFNYKQWIAECVFYWGLAGGIHSLLTPEFTLGMDGYNFIGYYITHAGLILVVAYLVVHYNFRPRPKSWLWILGYTQLVAIGVGLINYTVGANYMFLCKKPDVENPFLIGEWPYYILILELVAILHFYAFYLPFYLADRKKAKAIIA